MKIECINCGGTGFIVEPEFDEDGELEDEGAECPDCGGEGWVDEVGP